MSYSGLINWWQLMMGNPIGQWISINDNWLVVIDRYRPIYDQSIITSSSSLIAIDCYYLAGSLSMQLALDNSWKNISREWKYSTNWWTFNKGAKYPLHQWEHFYCSHGLCFVKNYSFEFGSVMKIRKVLLLLFTREMAAKHLLRLIPGF